MFNRSYRLISLNSWRLRDTALHCVLSFQEAISVGKPWCRISLKDNLSHLPNLVNVYVKALLKLSYDWVYKASEEKEKLTMDSHQRSSQVQETVAFLQRRAKEQEKKRLRLWEQAREDAEQILQYWIETYQPTRVWQWGSLLKREEFSKISDLDFAVEGLNSVQMLQLLADAEERSDFPVDLLHWETLSPGVQQLIKLRGQIVYEFD